VRFIQFRYRVTAWMWIIVFTNKVLMFCRTEDYFYTMSMVTA